MNRILTPREEEVMQILWHLKKTFVKEILEKFKESKPPYNTISSMVRKLEAEGKGKAGFKVFGNTYRYFPFLKKAAYRRFFLGNVIRE